MDFALAIGKLLGDAVTLVPGTFKDNFNLVKGGKLDALTDITPKPDREPFFFFSDPYISIPHVIVGRDDGPYYENEEALSGKTIALENGYYNNTYFKERFPEVNIREYPDTSACLDAVSRSEADAYVGNRAVANYLIHQELLQNLRLQGKTSKAPVVLSIGSRKDKPILARILNKALKAVREYDRPILAKWVDPEGADDLVSQEEKVLLEQHDALRLGLDPAWPPFAYFDDRGEYSGITSDYIRVLSERLNVDFTPLRSANWADMLRSVKAGQVDVIATIVRTPEREQYLAFTKPYLNVPLVIVTREDAPIATHMSSLNGKMVAVIEGYVGMDYLLRDHPDVIVKGVKDYQEGLKAVEKGECFAFLGNLASIRYMEQRYGMKNLVVSLITPYSYELCMGVRKELSYLVPVIEKVLDSLSDTQRTIILEKWSNMLVERQINWLLFYKLTAAILLPSLLIIALVIWWNRRLKSEVAQRKLAELKLMRNEALLREAQRIASIGHFVRDVRSGENNWSEQTFLILGYTPGEVSPSDSLLRSHIFHEDRDKVEKLFEASHEIKRFSHDLRIVKKDGTISWAHVQGRINRDEFGVPLTALGTIMDISQRKEYEAALIRGREVESSFAELAESMVSKMRLSSITDMILDVGQRITDSPDGFVGYIDEDTGKFLAPSMSKNTLDACNTPGKTDLFAKIQGIPGWGRDHKEAVLSNNVPRDPRSSGTPHGHIPINRFIYAPSLIGGELVGQVAFANAPREYTDDDLDNVRRLAAVFAPILLRKRYEDALRKSEEKFRALVESSCDWIWEVNHAGRYTYSSPRVLDILGYRPEEVLGKTPFDFMPEKERECIEEAFAEFVVGRAPFSNLDNITLNKDGEEVVLETSGVPILDDQGDLIGYRGIARDVTERKRAELELRKLWRAVESSPSTVVITDPHGNIEYVNPAFTAITGYTREEAQGQNPRILKSNFHDKEFYSELWQTITSGEVWRNEMCNRKKNGDLYWEQVTISPIMDVDGNITHFLALKDDISNKKDLEQLKGDVDRIMRHDLKTPLNSIVGMPQLLAMEGNLNEEQMEIVKAIGNAGTRMLRMIDMSLDLFKMETGAYEYWPANVNAVAVVNEIIEDCHSKLSAKSIEVAFTVNEAPPREAFWVLSEEQLLYSMLSNFLINAIEASPRDETVYVRIKDEEQTSIVIKNRGAVPEEIREHFFKKYKTHGKERGTGLGTYSSKLIADTMEYGLLMETSDQENTTTITVHLPKGMTLSSMQ